MYIQKKKRDIALLIASVVCDPTHPRALDHIHVDTTHDVDDFFSLAVASGSTF